MNPASPYRGRLAPSPTGYLHLGHARTFWQAQARARACGGTLILRNEDLDAARFKMEFVGAMLEDLRWFGFDWSEGPDVGGAFGPYSQNQRMGLYRAALDTLRAGNFVYPCTCSRKDIQTAVAAPHGVDEEIIYPGTCRPRCDPWQAASSKLSNPCQSGAISWPTRGNQVALSPEERGGVRAGSLDTDSAPGLQVGGEVVSASGRSDRVELARAEEAKPLVFPGNDAPPPARYAWRFRVPDGEVVSFTDGHFGRQSLVAGEDFGDFVVWRGDGVPAYQLACVVDDAAMLVTEVVRGADLLVSTARQLLLYRALKLAPPDFFHCELLCDAVGHRLAKRHDALSLRQLRAQGATPSELRAGWVSSQ